MSDKMTEESAGTGDDKWGFGPPDDSIPPEIAQLTNPGYQTFGSSEDGERLLRDSQQPRTRSFDAAYSDVSSSLR